MTIKIPIKLQTNLGDDFSKTQEVFLILENDAISILSKVIGNNLFLMLPCEHNMYRDECPICKLKSTP